MGLLSNRLGIQAMSLEDPTQPLLPPSALMESLGLGRSDAGVLMNEQQAMRLAIAHTCVKIISEDLSSTGHEIFQQMPDGSMRMATEHRLWRIIHDRPNPNMTAMVFWGALLASVVGWGNGYAWIKRDGAARVISLIPLAPGKTAPVQINGEMKYATTQTQTGAVAYIESENVLHVMGMTLDGVVGVGPITCINTFGLAAAAEKFGAQFFGNGARATGVFTYPGVLEDEALDNLKKSAREMATGSRALSPLILEEGMKWTQTSIAPNEAQFLETRRYQRSEIGGIYRVAAHLYGDLTRSTNNNIAEQGIDHKRYCLHPWAVRIEQEVNYKLLGGPFTMEHNFRDLERGDFESQAKGLQTLRNIAVLSTNDCLRDLRMNPLTPEEGGDVRTIQGAMIPLTSLVDGGASPAQIEPAASGSSTFNRIATPFRRLFRDAVGRVINRGGEAEFARKAFQPVVSSMAQTLVALRFGNCDLTQKELALIDAQTLAATDGSASWDRKDASAIASRVTERVFGVLAGEISE